MYWRHSRSIDLHSPSLLSLLDSADYGLHAGDDDLGRYISVVLSGADYQFDVDNQYTSGAASSFAGMVCSHDPHIGLTFRTVEGVKQLADDLSQKHLSQVAKRGFVAFHQSVRHGIVPYQAVTKSNSPSYRALSNVRIVQDVIWHLQYAVDGFIGNSRTQAFVGKRLDDVVENVLINRPGVVDFDFAIERRLDGATISMELVLLYEVSKVHAVADIKSH